MSHVFYKGIRYTLREAESVLDALQRHGVTVPFSCRSGVCHICLLRAESGTPPAEAQTGLRDNLVKQGYFLACRCKPEQEMKLAPARDADLFSRAVVRKKDQLAPDIFRVRLEPATALYYHAGQFINLRRHDGLTRSYSIASVPRQDKLLELHIKRIPDGQMSNWLCDEMREDDELEFQGPEGSSHYIAHAPRQNILLVGTGTGLAPLVGIARDALLSGHQGQVALFHGSRYADGLYLREFLDALSGQHENFTYTPCLSGDASAEGTASGRADLVALNRHSDLKGWRVYLCGHPAMVNDMREKAIAAGANQWDVHTDPFELSTTHGVAIDQGYSILSPGVEVREDGTLVERRKYPEPDAELWSGLGQGKLLMDILREFYTVVYEDPRLMSFFEGVTKQRAIEKQYNFLYQVFTGEKVYFGERPRNAHHWMVISDELFDYREELLAAIMRKHGLSEELMQRWRTMEELYREDIVKSKPWGKIFNGVELPYDGFDEITMDFGAMCDICEGEINEGETVKYHLRTGKLYCTSCSGDAQTAT